jgi:hypothetical protein
MKRPAAKKAKPKKHGNTGNTIAAKEVKKQSLTIRLSPEIKAKALSQPVTASAYIEKLIKNDDGKAHDTAARPLQKGEV